MVLDEILDLFEHPRWMMLDGKKKLDDVLDSIRLRRQSNILDTYLPRNDYLIDYRLFDRNIRIFQHSN